MPTYNQNIHLRNKKLPEPSNIRTFCIELHKVIKFAPTSFFKQLIANSTKDDPNIRYHKKENEETSELWRMNETVLSAMEDSDVYTGRYEVSSLLKNPGVNGLDLLTKYKTLIDHYTDPNSLGGQDITPEENLAMANKLFDWYKEVHK